MLIHELVNSKILPAMKGILTHRLLEANMSQRKIARFLGVTQPMISKFSRRSINDYYSQLLELGLTREIIDHYVEILIDLALNNQYERFIVVSYNVVNYLALRSACNTLKDLASLCKEGLLRDPEIEYYKWVLTRVLSITGIEKLLPEVGSNLVYAPVQPSGLKDIIGLSGRMVKSPSGVLSYGEPMYGGSRHVGRVLYTITKYNPDIKFCINIKYFNNMEEKLRKQGLKVVTTGPHRDEEDFWRSIESAALVKPDVICDLGGFRLEPITYLFFTTPKKIIEVLEGLIATYGDK